MSQRTKENFLVFGSPKLSEDEIQEVLDCLRSGWIGTGPRVARFEDAFAQYKGHEQAVAVNSCTAALHLALKSLDLQAGDEVITTPMTFCATVNAIFHAGATPVLADVDPDTFNIDPVEIRKRISPRTRAILPVHFAGRACDMDAIMAISKEHGLAVIEDCAHAIETEYKGRPAGTFGDLGCFSFYVTKNVVTGEGGMLLARDPGKINRLKTLALHGMNKDAWKRFGDDGYKHYQVTEVGFKYNMTDMQAALGIHQLEKVETYWKRREQIWGQYMEAFADLPVALPAPPEAETRHAYHLFSLLIDPDRSPVARDEFLDKMTKKHIGVGVHYVSLPEHPVYQSLLGWRTEDFPHAKLIGERTVSLPISAKLTDEDVLDVIEAVRSILAPN